jgi:CheY-like chemotaxis protein
VPIVALTANALEGARDRCLAAGMNDHLAKPFTREQLVEMLRRWSRTARTAEPAGGA